MMGKCRKMMDTVKDKIEHRDRIKLIGMLDVRVVLLVTNKQDLSVEKKSYASLAQIGAVFANDLARTAGIEIDVPSEFQIADDLRQEHGHGKLDNKQEPPPKKTTHAFGTVDQMSDPVWIAKGAGYEVGVYCKQKDARDDRVFVITAVEHDKTTLALHDPIYESKVEFKEDTMMLTDRLKIYKGVVQDVVPRDVINNLTCESITAQIDDVKHKYNSALRELEKSVASANYHKVKLLRNPTMAVAVEKISKGRLTLPPTSRSVMVSTNEVRHPAQLVDTVSVHDVKYFVSVLPLSVPAGNVDLSKGDAYIAPFSFVQATTNENYANVKITSVAQNDVRFPCFVNTKALERGDILRVYKPPKDDDGPSAKKMKVDGDADDIGKGRGNGRGKGRGRTAKK